MRHFTGLLLATLLSAAAVPASAQDWQAAHGLSVELSNFKFTPSELRLKRGTPYRIHFSNISSGGHDYVAKEFFDEATIDPEDKAKLSRGGIDLDRGQSIDIRLIANRAGSYKSRCTHFMHSMMGMSGTVVVD
jgi:plastocyanin